MSLDPPNQFLIANNPSVVRGLASSVSTAGINFRGRLRVIKQLATTRKFSLNIGSKSTRFGDVNLDIDRSCHPDIVADCRQLPFRSESFERVFFTDVIEHLPRDHEVVALREIQRVLCNYGELILSTPHDVRLFKFLDPAWYVVGHRHYTFREIESLLKTLDFSIDLAFTSGGIWNCINILLYCLFIYPLKKVSLLSRFSYPLPRKLTLLEDKEYEKPSVKGYTLFFIARKLTIRDR